MAFNGSLIKMGTDEFPLHYVVAESYTVTPNRRLDLDPGRDANGVMQRNVLAHRASTISFETRKLTSEDVGKLSKFLTDHYSNENEKKLVITYYCPDINDYKTGEFYVPDVEYPIATIDYGKKIVYYKPIKLEFIEY